jgi:hypothetical protein
VSGREINRADGGAKRPLTIAGMTYMRSWRRHGEYVWLIVANTSVRSEESGGEESAESCRGSGYFGYTRTFNDLSWLIWPISIRRDVIGKTDTRFDFADEDVHFGKEL